MGLEGFSSVHPIDSLPSLFAAASANPRWRILSPTGVAAVRRRCDRREGRLRESCDSLHGPGANEAFSLKRGMV